jgi:hypothetical protein
MGCQTSHMAGTSAFGHVTVRPVRVALVDKFLTPQALSAASRLATTHWGGMNYLLLPAPLSDRAINVARILVDVATYLHSGESPAVPDDLTYRAWPVQSPFDRGDNSLRGHVLPMESLQDVSGAPAIREIDRLSWSEDHPLAQALSVLHGELAADVDGYAPKERSQADLGVAGQVPSTVFSEGPLSRTRYGLFTPHVASYRGIVCVDPGSIHDLVGFWNLRASGADVVMLPLGFEELVAPYLNAWWDGLPGGVEDLMLWATSAELAAQAAAAVTGRFGGRLRQEQLTAVPQWLYVLPVETQYSQRFDVNLGEDDWHLRLPLPKLDFLPRASWYERFGVVSADIRISTSAPLQRQRSFSLPVGRELGAELLKTRTSPGISPFLLPSPDGFTVAVDARDDTVTVPAVGSMEILAALFRAIEAEVKRSDAGLYVERLIAMLGGVSEDGVALQPAVRAVLHRASTAPYGRPVAALVAEAKQRAGEWPESLFGRRRDYPSWAVQWLCDKGMLQARLKTKCPNCGNTLSVVPADLTNSVTCPLCATARPLALHLTALRPEWRLALHKDVQPERLFETMPVMAALSLIAGARGYGGDELHSAVGIHVSREGLECELDVVVASREREFPLVIIGECKSFRDSITDTDVTNILKVQRAFLDKGSECYVLFATMRERFSSEEVKALRQVAQTVPSTSPFRPRQSLDPIAPLLLDGRTLSTHSFSESSLLRAGGGLRSLSSLGVASCMRVLGLAGYAYEGNKGRDHFTASWTPDP